MELVINLMFAIAIQGGVEMIAAHVRDSIYNDNIYRQRLVS